jgi:G3E family GTPase
MDIPITIIGGYLGAGKTTLINRVLNHKGDLSGLAVLVNDFGDVNIDAILIRANTKDDQVFDLTNGCVCCTIQDDFSASLAALQNRDIKHVLFEASGVASPAKLRAQCSYPGFHPTSVFVLVDANQYPRQKKDKYIGYLVQKQVKEADVLVVTKSSVATIAGAFDGTPSIRHVDDPELFDELLTTRQSIPAPTNAIQDTPAFITTTLAQHTPVSLEALEFWLAQLPQWISRIKGFVVTDQGTRLIQGTGQYRELAKHDDAQTVTNIHRVVLITAQTHRADQLDSIATNWPGASSKE